MRKAILGLVTLAAVLAVPPASPAQNAAAPPSNAAPQAAPAEPAPAAAAPATAPQGGAPGQIAALQQQLREAGFAPGPVNGVMTDQTRRAAAIYQRRTGRPPEALAAHGGDPVKEAQTALQRLGLLQGPADGVVGPTTRDAIIRFQAARHLPVDPRVSDTLLAALDQGAASSTGAAAGSLSPPGGQATAPTAPPAEPGAQPAPEDTGRRPLPPGVNPPPIH